MTQIAPTPPRQKRKQPTPREVLRIVMGQIRSHLGRPYLRCPLCRGPIWKHDWDTVIREHLQALELGGEDTPANQAFVHAQCARKKTTGRKGASKLSTDGNGDISRIAKGKRIRGETGTGPKAKIQSPGFDKTLRKRFDGTVEKVPR